MKAWVLNLAKIINLVITDRICSLNEEKLRYLIVEIFLFSRLKNR